MIKKVFVITAFVSTVLLIASCSHMKSYDVSGTSNGHEYVDLGLSVKWAVSNVGAKYVSQVGNFFAWGETTQKDGYSYDNCKYQIDSVKVSKYCRNSKWGDVDNLATLESSDDAASLWGRGWRMPTNAEMQELIDKCTWELKSGGYFENGTLQAKNYYKVTGPSGLAIHLPLAGVIYGNQLTFLDEGCMYWTSSLHVFETGDSGCADALGAADSTICISPMLRFVGLPIRPVLDEN